MTRSLLFMAWAAVLWGSLVVLALAWTAITRGLGPALSAALPRHPDTWAWVNLVCAVLAVCVWVLVAVVRSRLDRA